MSTMYVRVKFDYAADGPGELSLKSGSILTLLEKDDETGWWKGRTQEGLVGYFPSNFIEEVSQEVAEAALAPAAEEASKPKPPGFAGDLKLWMKGVWLPAYGVIDEEKKVLVVYDDQAMNRVLAQGATREGVRRGAPTGVALPPGEDNCQFALSSILLSAPTFEACGEWVGRLKELNSTVQLARLSVQARDSEEAASETPPSSPLSPTGRSSSTLRKRLSTLRGSPRGSRSSGTVSSPTVRPKKQVEREESSLGTALDSAAKKASELLFRRKERKARKQQREEEEQAASAWPTVGRVQVPVDEPEPVKHHRPLSHLDSSSVIDVDLPSDLPPPEQAQGYTGAEEEEEQREDKQEVTVEQLMEQIDADDAVEVEEFIVEEDVQEEPPVPEFEEEVVEEEEVVVVVHEERGRDDAEIARLQRELKTTQTQLAKEKQKAKTAVDWANQRSRDLKAEAETLKEQVSSLEQQVADVQLREESSVHELQQARHVGESVGQELLTLQEQQEKTALELKLRDETVERQKAKLQVLMEEKMLNRTAIKELREQLEQQLQAVFSENSRTEELEAQVKTMQEAAERQTAMIAAKTAEVESLTALVDDQKERITTLTKQTEEDGVQLTTLKQEMQTQKVLHVERTTELEQLRTEASRDKAQHEQREEELQAELTRVQETATMEVERLKRSVEAISSGRGRLEQLEELQRQLDEAQREHAEQQESLEERVEELEGEIEGLAESNQQLIAALEGGEEQESTMGAFSVLEIRGLEERIQQLEGEMAEQMEAKEKSERNVETLKQGLAVSRAEVEDRTQKIYMLVDRVRAAEKEKTLTQDALASTKAVSDAREAEHVAQMEEQQRATQEVEKKLALETEKRTGLEAELAEANSKLDAHERFRERAAAEAEEAAADTASIRARLNEAIQERYRVQSELERMSSEKDRQNAMPGGVTLEDFIEKERVMKRRIQDLEGEVKRSKMGSQDKQRLAQALTDVAQLQVVTKKMAAQIVELERDLELSEQACDEYEQLIQTLRDASASGK